MLPVWLVAGAAVGWLAIRWRERSTDQRLAESRLDAIGAASTDAILRVDADGVVSDWSAGAQALYGYEADEIIGRPVADLLGEEESDRVAEAIREGGRLDEVSEQRSREGDLFTAAVTTIPSADPPEAVVVARDVGEVGRLTRELRNARATDRSLREHLPVVTYVRSFEGREMTFVSPQIDRLVGYTADEWLADPGLFARLVHPDDRDEVLAERDAVDAAKPARLSYRMLARDGRVVWVREEAVAVLDESGRPLSIQGYLLDVGERKAAEDQAKELRTAEAVTAEEARDRQRKIEFVAEAASVLASSLDVSSTVGEVAKLATRALAEWCVVDVLADDGSVTRYAVAGADPTSAATEPDPEPEPAVGEVIRNRRPELSATHMRLPLASGGRRALGALTLVAGERAAPYEGTDLPWGRAVAGMIALALDNSRLHDEVEARSDANMVLTHVGEGVFLVDRAGVVRLWNPASAAITGVSAEAAAGTPVSDAIPDWHELSARIPLGTAGGEPVRPVTLPLDTVHGERWISISGVEFIAGTVYALRDITEEHRLDELKAEFIATASHELRTPLAAVYGAAQTLSRHDFALDEAGRARFVSLIVDESDRLAAIVNQILLANQLEVGRVDLETEPFDGADLVERVVESAKTHAPSHITFDVRVAEGVPPVAADKDRARQVLVNLVENAVKYSPGGGTIQVSLEAADGPVQFSVVDEGMGIPSDEQARIFEKFYRLDPNMTSGIGGTGLGLYICSELVERMGGRIWLESEEGKGSAFYFQLPSTTARTAARLKLAESEQAAG